MLCNFAMEVMFNGVFRCASAPQQANVRGTMASLESPVCAPAVPKRAECRRTDPRRSELSQQLQTGNSAPGLPSGCVLPSGGVGWCRVLAWVVELPSHELVPVTNGRVVWFGLYKLIVCLPLELASGIGAWRGVVVLGSGVVVVVVVVVVVSWRRRRRAWRGFWDRSDIVGVVLFVGLQRESKRSSVPGVPAETVIVVVALIESRAQVSGILRVVSVLAGCVPPPDPELGCGSRVCK